MGDEIGRMFPAYAQEVADLKVLASYSLANLLLYSNRVAVHSLSDIKGRTVRSGNRAISEFVKKVGGNPLFMSMGEVYMGLQKGTVDIMAGYPSTLGGGYRHAEVAKYVTTTLMPGGAPNIGFVGMNWNSWKKLPSDLQRVIEASAVRLEYESRKLRVDEVVQGLDFAKSKNCEIMELVPEDKSRIKDIMRQIAMEEAKRMDAEGLKGSEFMEVSFKAAAKIIE